MKMTPRVSGASSLDADRVAVTQCGHYFGLHARTTIRRMNLSPFRFWLGVLLLLGAVVGGVPAWSQTRHLPDAPGTWKPWKPLSTTTGAGGAREQAATPALVKAFEAELLALNAILRRATGVASPVGFSVETWGSSSDTKCPSTRRVSRRRQIADRGRIHVWRVPHFRVPEERQDHPRGHRRNGASGISINQIGRGLIDSGSVADWGSLDTDAFPKPMPQGEIAGLPATATA